MFLTRTISVCQIAIFESKKKQQQQTDKSKLNLAANGPNGNALIMLRSTVKQEDVQAFVCTSSGQFDIVVYQRKKI